MAESRVYRLLRLYLTGSLMFYKKNRTQQNNHDLRVSAAHVQPILSFQLAGLRSECLVCAPSVWFALPVSGLHSQCLVCAPRVWFALPVSGLRSPCLVCAPSVWFALPVSGLRSQCLVCAPSVWFALPVSPSVWFSV